MALRHPEKMLRRFNPFFLMALETVVFRRMCRFSRPLPIRTMAGQAGRCLSDPAMGLIGRYLGIFLARNTQKESNDDQNEGYKYDIISHKLL